jgi:uncharacterized protein YjbI with pentapeptide repeats
VAKVLAAFVRQHESGQCSPPGPGSQEQTRLTRPDVQAAVSVIGRQLPSEIGTLDFTEVNLTSVDLTHLNITGANLTGADLSYANLTSAILARTDLADADLTSANLSRANLTGANLADANAADAYLHDADLTDVDFTHAQLKGAHWPQNAAVPQGWKPNARSGLLRALSRLRR